MDKEPDKVWIEYTFWIGLDKGTGSEGGEGTETEDTEKEGKGAESKVGKGTERTS